MDQDLKKQKADETLKKFLSCNPFGNFFKDLLGPGEIVCLKLSCKAFKESLDLEYPPYANTEKEIWLPLWLCCMGDWKVGLYLLEKSNSKIPQFLKHEWTTSLRFQYVTVDSQQVPYFENAMKLLFPNERITLDMLLQLRAYPVLEAHKDEVWFIHNLECCVTNAVDGPLFIMEFLHKQYSTNENRNCVFNNIANSYVFRQCDQQHLEWLLKNGYRFKLATTPTQFGEDAHKFIVDHIDEIKSDNIDCLALAACMYANDLAYFASKRPERYQKIISNPQSMRSASFSVRKRQTYRDNWETFFKYLDANELLAKIDYDDCFDLVLILLKHMEENSIPLRQFPETIIQKYALVDVKIMHAKYGFPPFHKGDIFDFEEFDKFLWALNLNIQQSQKQAINLKASYSSPLMKDKRFLDWMTTQNPNERHEINISNPEVCCFLLKEFPRHTYVTKESLLKIRDLNLVKTLDETYHIDRRDKMELLIEFNTSEITDYLLEDYWKNNGKEDAQKIPMDAGLSKPKIWLFDFVKNVEQKPWRSLLFVKNPFRVKIQANLDHKYVIDYLLNRYLENTTK